MCIRDRFICSSVKSPVGMTPAKLLFGRKIRLPKDLKFGSPKTQLQEPQNYSSQLEKPTARNESFDRERLKIARDKMPDFIAQRRNHMHLILVYTQIMQDVTLGLCKKYSEAYYHFTGCKDITFIFHISNSVKLNILVWFSLPQNFCRIIYKHVIHIVILT